MAADGVLMSVGSGEGERGGEGGEGKGRGRCLGLWDKERGSDRTGKRYSNTYG